MRHLLILFMVITLCIPLGGITQAQTTVLAPNIFLRGMHLPEGVRYTATFIKPSDSTTIKNLSVEITLPPDVRFLDMLIPKQTQFHVIRVNRQNALTLIWQTSRIDSASPVDTFSFTVSHPISSPVEFYLEWQTEDNFKIVENFLEIPPVISALQTEGSIFPVPELGFQPVEQTAIQLASTSQEALLGVKLLPNDFNPPPEYGDLWWCSLLELNGLAQGSTAEVLVPLRRPIAPFTALAMFQQQTDGSWKALESQAVVTADGLFARYTHTGGLIATGGESGLGAQILPISELIVVQEEQPAADQNKDAPPDSPEQAPPPDGGGGEPAVSITEGFDTLVGAEPDNSPANPQDQQSSTVPIRPETAADPANPDRENVQFGSEFTPVAPDENKDGVPNPPVQADGSDTTNNGGEASVEVIETTTFSLSVAVIENETPSTTGENPPPAANTGVDTAQTPATGNETTATNPANTNPANTSGEESPSAGNSGETTTPAPTLENTAVVVNPDPTSNSEALPFGGGGARIEIITSDSGEVLQCQVGQINCVILFRQAGTR